MRRMRGGFTLLEIMIVVAIVSILAVVGVPNYFQSQKHAQERSCLETIRAIYGAQQQHHAKFGEYAPSIDQLCAAQLLNDPFRVGGNGAPTAGMQQKGFWEFVTVVPSANSIKTGLPRPPDEVNRTLRFRIGAQPLGTSREDRLKRGDQMYMMTEEGRLYTHRYTEGCDLTHVKTTLQSSNDTVFGGTYPPTDGQ